MTSFFLVAITIGSTFAQNLGQRIVSESIDIPTCYQRPNTAVLQGIKHVESKAKSKCDAEVILKDLQVKVMPFRGRNSACGGVKIRAEYFCVQLSDSDIQL